MIGHYTNIFMLSTNVSTVHFKELSFSPLPPPCFIEIPIHQLNNRKVKAQEFIFISRETNTLEFDFVDSQLLNNCQTMTPE